MTNFNFHSYVSTSLVGPYILKDLVENYDKLKALSADGKTSIIHFDKATQTHVHKPIFRTYKAYGISPKFDPNRPKSYMFSDVADDETILAAIPEEIEPLKAHIEYHLNKKFNQCVINWYNNQEDYMEPHGDCTAGMIEDPSIIIVNLNSPTTSNNDRHFTLQSREGEQNPYINTLSFNLVQGLIIEMSGECQRRYRHSVSKGKNPDGGRISITFRQMKED